LKLISRELLVNITIGIMFFHCMFMFIRPLSIKEYEIRLSIWIRTFPIYLTIPIYFIFISRMVRGQFDNPDMFSLVGLFVFCSYVLYFFFMFKYRMDEDEFVWFNGIANTRINAKTVTNISLHLIDGKVRKIEFIFGPAIKSKKMRNDLGVEWLVIKYAKKNNIPINENLG